jgi:hypothetical protein
MAVAALSRPQAFVFAQEQTPYFPSEVQSVGENPTLENGKGATLWPQVRTLTARILRHERDLNALRFPENRSAK